MNIRVKICGITSAADAQAAIKAGADAIGLIFWPESARAVTVEAARAIAHAVSPFTTVVGVFVNTPVAEIRAVRAEVGLHLVQLHGDEPPETAAALGPGVLKGVRTLLAHPPESYAVAGFVLDGAPAERYGGAGMAADLGLAPRLAAHAPLILAGGLDAANVAARCRAVRPYGVDVASGVESAPGRKDFARMAAFVNAVRALGC